MRVSTLILLMGFTAGLMSSDRVSAADSDGDGVSNALDLCPNTPPDTLVDPDGRPLGDLDLDCDTDLADFVLFEQGFTGPQVPPVTIATVEIGNPGNVGELSGAGAGGDGPDRICGAVDYRYEIDKYEVTAKQYVAFLNAVAADDTYRLYNEHMWSNEFGCKIARAGSPGSYTYSVAPEWADRAVNYVNWGDAARFANWLHNGQPTGTQNLTTTEDGSYHLDGAMTEEELMAVVREADATWVIPSEDEWYKAAYHCNDGVTGNYFDYPTGSDQAPTSEPPPGLDMTNGSANYSFALGGPYYRTEIGAYQAKPSESPYGTYDQGGNVWEWTEAVIEDWARCVRGGSFGNGAEYMWAPSRQPSPVQFTYLGIGFRVALIRQPPSPPAAIGSGP